MAPCTSGVNPDFKKMSKKGKSIVQKEYAVQKILKKRMLKGKTQYLVKWLRYKVSESTWEPSENLNNCQSLIDAFEFGRNKSRPKPSQDVGPQHQLIFKRGTLNAFCRGLKPKSIIAVTEIDDMVLYIIDFEGGDKPEPIHSDIAIYECPELVLTFFGIKAEDKQH